MIFIGDIRNFVFGCVKIMRFFREQMSSGIRWAAGHRGLEIWGMVQDGDI